MENQAEARRKLRRDQPACEENRLAEAFEPSAEAHFMSSAWAGASSFASLSRHTGVAGLRGKAETSSPLQRVLIGPRHYRLCPQVIELAG